MVSSMGVAVRRFSIAGVSIMGVRSSDFDWRLGTVDVGLGAEMSLKVLTTAEISLRQ